MGTVTSCIESLERRMLLDGAIEVWAGNTDVRSYYDSYDALQNIDKQGYTKIGESNAANATVAFSSSTSYKYFVVATRGRVRVDSIRASSGSYISSVEGQTNTDFVGNVIGASNSTYADVGTRTGFGTFAGAMFIVAPTTWSGLTIKTGSIEPLFKFWVDFDRMYVPGTSTPYGVHADLMFQNNGLVQSARVHTPAGRNFDLHAMDGEYGALSAESYFANVTAANEELGDGTYKLTLQTPVGQRTYNFNGTGISFPSQIPSSTSLGHGKTNTPSVFDPALPALNSTINHVSLYISDDSEEKAYDEYIVPPGGSLPTVNLTPGKSYLAELTFGAGKWQVASGGYEFGYSKSNEAGYVFATAGFTQTTPDLQGKAFAASPITVQPGGSINISVSVSGTGGMAYSKTQPLKHLIGLSKNKVIGDADDVILFAPLEPGQPAGGGFTGTLTALVPQTAPAGQYYVFGKTDSGNAIAETNESNNIGWSATAVVTIPPQAITLDLTTHKLSMMGTAGNDTIKVTVDAQTVYASIGATTRSFAKSAITSVYISGNVGNDAITVANGMSGVTIYGGDGNDTIYAGSGNDVIYGNGGDDRIYGQDGADSVYAGLGADFIDGGIGNDSLIGGDQSDTIYGGAGNDYIEGKGKADTLYGGLGNDTILGGAGNNIIKGDDGDDTIYALNLTGFRDTINGGAGTDTAQSDSNDLLVSVEQLLG